ncbi:MAG: UDP-N-acetylmuramoyl-L-alanine--D-glutamate ligase [Oscillospiraceae bacterium]|nr:UDP-N-acetylmuramoyl-L-alanine--D-glutamate ligase [Oscillospiraceae bacterium]
MLRSAERFFNSLKGKTAAFIGVGVSNTDTMRLFLSRGVRVIACDRKNPGQLDADIAQLADEGAELRLGENYLDGLDADIVMRTPGMYFHRPELEAMRNRGVIVTSETEIFFGLAPCKTIAVTGSEGKTTTTTIIAEILKAQGHTVHLGGNIGRALLPLIFDIKPGDIAVAELSSFQLISMRPQPDVSVITNITPDHLDVHRSLDEYINAKRNVYLHQTAFSRTVLNSDNDATASFIPEVRGECMEFSLKKPVYHGAYLEKDEIVISIYGEKRAVMPIDAIKLPGMHNAANYMAAICAVWGDAGVDAIRKTAEDFAGVEHRLEFVREVGGVRWFNDTIATAPMGVIAGLRAFGQKLIIIGGGSDKGISYSPLAPEFIERVKLLILTGPTGPMIADAVRTHPDYNGSNPIIVMAKDIPHAVEIARERAVSGDIVSLSPASASFDAYTNFAARGRHFKELVNALR